MPLIDVLNYHSKLYRLHQSKTFIFFRNGLQQCNITNCHFGPWNEFGRPFTSSLSGAGNQAAKRLTKTKRKNIFSFLLSAKSNQRSILDLKNGNPWNGKTSRANSKTVSINPFKNIHPFNCLPKDTSFNIPIMYIFSLLVSSIDCFY